jgi:hypothetical protein
MIYVLVELLANVAEGGWHEPYRRVDAKEPYPESHRLNDVTGTLNFRVQKRS